MPAMKSCSNCGDPFSPDDDKKERCGRCSPGRPRAAELSTSPSRSSIDVDEAISLREGGATLKVLAERYGVSRQCVSRTVKTYTARRAGEPARFRKGGSK